MKSYLDRRGGYKRRLVVNPVKYAHLVEGGRKANRVRTKRVMSDGRVVFGKRVRAVPPRPFLQPAYQRNVRRVEAAMWQEFAKAADRVPRVKAAIPFVPRVP